MPEPRPTNYAHVLKLAWPLIVSNSFTTIQITVDRYFLSKYDPEAVSAATSSVMLFWTPFVLLFFAAGYVSTFVAQYTGAKRPERVGPAVWQAIYFSLAAGLLFLTLIPFAQTIVVTAHGLLGDEVSRPGLRILAGSAAGEIDFGTEFVISTLRIKEAVYFECLCWLALPNLLVAATSAFFSGRGESGTVMWINGVGMVVNAVLAPLMIFGRGGFPELGIAGAGYATVIATWLAALVGLGLVFRKRFRTEFNLIGGWRFDRELFGRLMWYGLPSGFQWMLDTLAFAVFLFLSEKFGEESLAASSLAFTINGLIFIPMVGLGQAASILVGQRLGDNDPQQAEKLTWVCYRLAFIYIGTVGLLFVLFPKAIVSVFESEGNPEQWARVAEQLQVLLYFIAFYSVFDSVVLVFSFALKGAGDTVFVTAVSLILSWPIMVLPTFAAWKLGWSFYWSWGFASAYIAAQAICFVYRFRAGKWKSMRVIEHREPGVDDGAIQTVNT